MYKVLIAEDELFVRLGIKNSIDWEACNMQVICDVSNGEQALSKAKEYEPDIVITDILMPGMNGEELIEELQKLSFEPYIIVITCLEDFLLVKKLLSKGIRDYILKATMTENEIMECLERAHKYLAKHKQPGLPSDLPVLSPSEICNKIMEDFYQENFPQTIWPRNFAHTISL